MLPHPMRQGRNNVARIVFGPTAPTNRTLPFRNKNFIKVSTLTLTGGRGGRFLVSTVCSRGARATPIARLREE